MNQRETSGREMLGPASHLLKRREAIEAHHAMDLEIKELESTLRALRVQKSKLKENVEQMENNKQEYVKFFKDNEVKQARARRKVDWERKLTNQKQAELLALQKEMEALIKERDQLVKRVERNDIYHQFLEKVVQASEQQCISNPASKESFQFQNVDQVMSRYETLKLMRDDLLQMTQQNQDKIEESRAQLAHFTQQARDTLLHFNNSLAQLECQLVKAQADGIIWESRWAHIQNTAAKKTLLLGTIKMATFNLYRSVCKVAKDSGEAPFSPEDTLKQLDKIRKFLSNEMSILEEVSRSERVVLVRR